MTDLDQPVPKDYAANLAWRRSLLLEADPVRQAYIKRRCERDILFWVNSFVFQFNPNKRGRQAVGPFVTWPFQDDALRLMNESVEDGKDLVVEKSRDMGVSWMVLMTFSWRFWFLPYQKFHCITRKEDLTDSPDQDSLFWKVDFIHRHLPEYLTGPGPLVRKTQYIGRPGGYCSMTAEASVGAAGVSGRATAMFVDEFAQIKADRQVMQRTSDTTRCRIFVGTHVGTETEFAKVCRRPDMKKIVLHWTLHPEKIHGLYRSTRPATLLDNGFHDPDYPFVTDGTPVGGARPGVRSPWYDQQCVRKGSPIGVAMDLDINPSGATAQFFDMTVIAHLKEECTAPTWAGDIVPDEYGVWKLVPSVAGKLRLWMNLEGDGSVPPGAYCIAADVAAGTGSSPSCLSIVKAMGDTGDRAVEKVGEYADALIEPAAFGEKAVALARMFATHTGEGALVAWEGPGSVGSRFKDAVMNAPYRHIWFQKNRNRFKGKMVESEPGWWPTNTSPDASKFVVLSEYAHALATRRFHNPSADALEETALFEHDGRGGVHHAEEAHPKDASGATVNHGDRATADALAWRAAADLTPLELRAEPPPQFHPGSLAGRRALAYTQSRREEPWGW